MTISYSKALKNFIESGGSIKQALSGGIINVYSGPPPVDADAAVTGTLLYQFTDYAGSRGGETLATGSAVYTGSMGGRIDTLTVNGVSIIGSFVSNLGASLSSLMTALASRINSYVSSPDYSAVATANSVIISAMPGTATIPNGYVVAGTLSQVAIVAGMSGGMAATAGSPEVRATTSMTFGGTGANYAGGPPYAYNSVDPSPYTPGGGNISVGATYSSSMTQLAADMAAAQTAASTFGITATSSGPTLTLRAPAGSGTNFNGIRTYTILGRSDGFNITCTNASGHNDFSGGAWPVPAGPETLATATIDFTGAVFASITDLTVNGVSIINAAVPFNTTISQTVADLVASINTKISVPNYTASSFFVTNITISAVAGSGATPNGYPVSVTCSPALANVSYNNMAGGTATVGLSYTLETRATGTMTLTGGAAGNTINAVTVNAVNILAFPVPFNASLAQTAADLAAAINVSQTTPEYTASSAGAVVTFMAQPGTGTQPNGYVVASSLAGMTATHAPFAGGVNSVNGLKFDYSSDGILRKLRTQTWYACPAADATGGYFRFITENGDVGQADTAERYNRVQGTVGSFAEVVTPPAVPSDMRLLKATYGKEQSIALTDVRLVL